MATHPKKLLRILDANCNRAKEGLRVCEDITRYILDRKTLSGRHKKIRHALAECIKDFGVKALLESRNIENDVGRGSSASEMKRTNVLDIYLANAQRVKESLRVLEEFAKLKKPSTAETIKQLRYSFYAIEKKVVQLCV